MSSSSDSNFIKLSDLTNKLESQLKLIASLEQELNDLHSSSKYSWRFVMKQFLSNISDRIQDLDEKQSELKQNNTLLKHKIRKLNDEINELTIARRKLSPSTFKPASISTSMPTTTFPTHTTPPIHPTTTAFPKAMMFSPTNSSAIHPSLYTKRPTTFKPNSMHNIERIKPIPSIFNHNNWRFESLKNAMADSAQIEQISKQLGMHNLPEMVFPNSYLKISLPVK